MTKPGVKTILLISVLVAGMLWWLLPRKTAQPVFTSSVFVTDKGWGYDIRVNDSLLIHQDVIPALPVNAGFANKEQAEAAASRVVNKLRKKEYPTLSADEVKQLMTAPGHE
ncbi:MAG: hypothetical protein ABS85_06990 [Sphingobacteriales bacterium SCN 48-20]|uniref:DUF4907 domain-containing protein n=1 Tax=Terrimonas ferruginea TaxID=249 RepID=UPI000868488E|nr:DUF4907 domain-containing protein [Terrimonas ferruginea]MBN8782362.1 DUF4907 domain-containing protein [Terrimonas ferruginea]ODT93008.1 MAG: hypothetical protein ABS85_06990 [Sphingobacteriales bacterium SCN 48-20]OJW42877.1 MAG: hypothetical protein BGO56_12665 [Sphingobacteriales bacterium 48-107]